MTEQNLETIIVYLESIQLPPEGCTGDESFPDAADPAICEGGVLPGATRDEIQAAVDRYMDDNPGASEGEALFNLPIASGAYSCARCHTPGWSYGNPGVDAPGAFGWNLTGGATNSHFANEEDMIAFVRAGPKNGARYGVQSQRTGRMPGFCVVPAIEAHTDANEVSVTPREAGTAEDGAMMTQDQVVAIVQYVRSLNR